MVAAGDGRRGNIEFSTGKRLTPAPVPRSAPAGVNKAGNLFTDMEQSGVNSVSARPPATQRRPGPCVPASILIDMGRPRTIVLWTRSIPCATEREAAALARELRQQHPHDFISTVPPPDPKTTNHANPDDQPPPLRPHRRTP